MSNAELVSTRDAMKRLADRLLLCSVCHKVRDGESLWLYLDEYLKARGRMEFSHGLCPECKATHYPSLPPGDQRIA
jgi:hypothetical protein